MTLIQTRVRNDRTFCRMTFPPYIIEENLDGRPKIISALIYHPQSFLMSHFDMENGHQFGMLIMPDMFGTE